MKTSIKRTTLLIIASALALVFNTSCGTAHGFGHDVENVGENIQETAH